MNDKVALITGGTGVVGWRLAMYLAERGDWVVHCVSRNLPTKSSEQPNVNFHSLDLTDGEGCEALCQKVSGISHVINAARFDHDTSKPEDSDINTRMLMNLLDSVERNGHPLQHVHMVQGTKYYGSNLGPFPTPAMEDDPRCLQSNFYYDQQDTIAERASKSDWGWSASRPHGVCDKSIGISRSMSMVISVYALVSKELGLPLDFPGTPENYTAIYQCTDAQILAEAIEWMCVTPAAADNAFNVTNGDYIRWSRIWRMFAEEFDMPMGEVRTVSLARVMSDKAEVWSRIVKKYGLLDTPYENLALWTYGDFLFKPSWDMMSSTSKLRKFGFHGHRDTYDMFRDLLAEFRSHKVIP